MIGGLTFPRRGAPLAKAAPAPVRKALEISRSAAVFFGLTDAAGAQAVEQLVGLRTFAVSALAYILMAYRATKLTEPNLWILEETADGERWVEGAHPLEAVLEQPNPDMDMSELLEVTSLYLDADGRALWHKVRDRGNRVARLYPYASGEYQTESDGERLVARVRIQTTRGPQTVPTEDVILFKRTDPRSPVGGLGPLDAALAHLNLGHELAATVKAALRNTARPGGVVTVPGEWGDVTFERFKAEWNAAYGGALNAGRSAVLEGGATFEQLRAGLADLDLGPLQGTIEKTVCAVFGIHPILVGLDTAAGFADSLKPAEDRFYDRVAFPEWARFERALTRGLLREVDPNPRRFIRFDLSKVRALAEDQGQKIAEAKNAAGFWTVDEQRVHSGQAALEDERGESIAAPPDAPQPPGQMALPVALGTKARRAPSRETVRAVHEAVAAQTEALFEIAAGAQLARDRDAATAIVRSAGVRVVKEAQPTPPSDAELARLQRAIDAHLDDIAAAEWRARFAAPINAAARGAVERLASSVGVDFAVLQPGLQRFVEREVAFLVTSVTDTTKDGIRRAVAAALEAGDGLPELATRIAEIGEFAPSRAKLIARTETTRATNGAQRETIREYGRESGLTIRKSWLTAGDDRVRDEHRELDGETVGVDEPFSNGRLAPDEPNCRCTLTYSVEEAA